MDYVIKDIISVVGTFNRDLRNEEESTSTNRKAFQAEGTACKTDLRQECMWQIKELRKAQSTWNTKMRRTERGMQAGR